MSRPTLVGPRTCLASSPRVAATDPCAKCHRPIAPGWLYTHVKGKPVHIGACPTPGQFTAARVQFETNEGGER